MNTHLQLMQLLMSTENYADSLKTEIEQNSKLIEREQGYITRCAATATEVVFDDEYIEQLLDRNSEAALAIMYLKTVHEEISGVLDYTRLLSELNGGYINIKTFNTRYEELTFGD